MTPIVRALFSLTALGLLPVALAAQASSLFHEAQFVSVNSFGEGPFSVAMEDLNGDGNLDVAVAWYDYGFSLAGKVSILPGTGTGSFGAPTAVSSIMKPNRMAIGDWKVDGAPDFVTADYDKGDVVYLLGTGALGFNWAYGGVLGNYPSSVAIADLNEDAKPDVVLATANSVSLLWGTGTGSVAATSTLDIAGAGDVVIGDLNEDGHPDLAIATGGSGSVTVLLGAGTGSFGTPATFSVGGPPSALALGELNGDGHLDLVAAAGNGVSVLLGTGDGTFGMYAPFSVGTSPGRLALGDLNGDGNTDVVTTNGVYLSVSLGTGLGTFGPQESVMAGKNPGSVAIGDLNGDGRPDVVTTNHGPSLGISVLFNAGSTTSTAPWTYLGHALGGDQVPLLTGIGPLTPGSATQLDLTNVLPGAPAILVAGLTALNAPFKGGVLAPKPDFVLPPVRVNDGSYFSLFFHWPAAAPAGLKLYLQYWVASAAGPNGFVASNGLQAIGQ